MMKRIIAEIATVPFSDGEQDLQRRARGRRAPARSSRSAPTAADSVGVPQPAAIAPTDHAEDRDQRQHVQQEAA